MALVILPEDNLTDFSKIIPPKGISGGLYLGNIRAAQNISLLKKNKITAIITIASQIVIQFDNKINHLKIDIDDSPLENIHQYFELASQFIEKHRKNGNVFVHCKAGISRSASLVIAYLMKSKQYNFLQAYKRVKIRRNIVHPNQGFQLQLKDYQKLIIKQKQALKSEKLKA